MQGPGGSLRQAREAHGRTLEEMAQATGIRLPFLTALEQDAFDSLPGRGFGKLYIRAYAEVLGFDPRPMIEEYDRAVRTMDAATPPSEPVPAPRPVNPVLRRWRKDLIARRAEADFPEEPEEEDFDQFEPAEDDPEPEAIEDPGRTVPRSADSPGEPIKEVPAPPLLKETGPLPHPAPKPWRPGASLLLLVLLPALAYFVVSRSRPHPPDVPEENEVVPGKAMAPP